ncbi:MAG: serine/threonine protein kinase [Planctomycetota bacterium]|nr:MAG: serine/threonine protein kinase [Planctomycetota bacterium]
MSYGEDRQIAGFLIEKEWVPAERVVYFLEIARMTEKSLKDLLIQNNLITPSQLQIIEEQIHGVQNKIKSGKNRIPNYKIVAKLGTGGMGSVFKAIDLRDRKEVAIKVLSKQFSEDEEYVRRFRREARTMLEMNHPNIVRAYECGQADGLWYLVMEYVEGKDGFDLLKEKRLSERFIIHIGAQMANAMAYYDKRGMVHRDIKPDNLLITASGQCKLCDLGLAKRASMDSKITAAGVTLGTPQYLSPEQAKGEELDIRSDIYSLGATLFHLATGREPYVAKNIIVIMQKHIHEKIPSLREFRPDLSENLEYIITKMLAKNRRHRYQTPEELYHDFYRLSKGEKLLASSPVKSKVPKGGTNRMMAMKKLAFEGEGYGTARRKAISLQRPHQSSKGEALEPAMSKVRKSFLQQQNWIHWFIGFMMIVILVLIYILLNLI